MQIFKWKSIEVNLHRVKLPLLAMSKLCCTVWETMVDMIRRNGMWNVVSSVFLLLLREKTHYDLSLTSLSGKCKHRSFCMFEQMLFLCFHTFKIYYIMWSLLLLSPLVPFLLPLVSSVFLLWLFFTSHLSLCLLLFLPSDEPVLYIQQARWAGPRGSPNILVHFLSVRQLECLLSL